MFSCTNVQEDPLPVVKKTPPIELKEYQDGFNFYVISDLGKNGHKNQQLIANQMADLSARIDPQFIVSRFGKAILKMCTKNRLIRWIGSRF